MEAKRRNANPKTGVLIERTLTPKEEREVVWAGVKAPSLEHCSVTRESRGWKFNGLAVLVRPAPYAVYYQIMVDKLFKTRRVKIKKLQGKAHDSLDIRTSGENWFVNGKEKKTLQGCTDIDLEVSPVTNTLPIRRAHLRIGGKIDLTAAWVRFPTMSVQPLNQSYTRLDEKTYRYRSGSGFTSKLEVDGFGLVTRYGNIWKRVTEENLVSESSGSVLPYSPWHSCTRVR